MVMGTMSVTPNQAAMASGADLRLREARIAAEERVRAAQRALQAEIERMDAEYAQVEQQAQRRRMELAQQFSAAQQTQQAGAAGVQNPYATGQAGIATYRNGGAVPRYDNGGRTSVLGRPDTPTAPPPSGIMTGTIDVGLGVWRVWNGQAWVSFATSDAARAYSDQVRRSVEQPQPVSAPPYQGGMMTDPPLSPPMYVGGVMTDPPQSGGRIDPATNRPIGSVASPGADARDVPLPPTTTRAPVYGPPVPDGYYSPRPSPGAVRGVEPQPRGPVLGPPVPEGYYGPLYTEAPGEYGPQSQAPSPSPTRAPGADARDIPLPPVSTRPSRAAAAPQEPTLPLAPMVMQPSSLVEASAEAVPPAPAGPSMLPARSVPADPDVAAGAADARAEYERAQAAFSAVRGQMRPPGQPSDGMIVPPSVVAATNTVRFPDVLPPAPLPPEPRFGRTAAGNVRVTPGQSDAWNDWYAQTGQAPPFAPAPATNPALRFAEGGAFGLPPAPSDALRSDEMESAEEPNAITGEEPMGDDYRAELVIGPPGSGDRAVYHTEGPRASNLDEGTIIVPVAGVGEDEARMFPLAPGMAATKQGNRYKAGGKLYGKGGKVKRMAEGGAYGLPPAPKFKSPWSTRNTAPVPGLHPPGFTGETPRATGPGSYPLPGTGVLGMAPWAGYQLPPAPINMQQWLQWDDEQRRLYDQQLKSMGYMQGVAGVNAYLTQNAPGTVGGGVYAG